MNYPVLPIEALDGKVFFGKQYTPKDISLGGSSIFLYHPGDSFGVKYIFIKDTLHPFAKSEYDANRESDIGKFIESLQRPNLCGVLETQRYNHGMALQIRYAGAPLNQLENITPAKSCQILRDICSGLTVLHQNNMVHNDISPQNIAVLDNRAALIDFGEVRRLGIDIDLPRLNPFFAAPELLNGGPMTYSSDIYSVGKVADVLLRGDYPSSYNSSNPFNDLLRTNLALARKENPIARPSAQTLYQLLRDYVSAEQQQTIDTKQNNSPMDNYQVA